MTYVFAAFMRHCQLKNLEPYSYLYYNKNIQYFLDAENDIKYVDEICPEVIERFIGKLMDRGNKVTVINWVDMISQQFNIPIAEYHNDVAIQEEILHAESNNAAINEELQVSEFSQGVE